MWTLRYFSTVFGLVTKHDPTSENSGLFYTHYLTLRDMIGIPEKDIGIFSEKMKAAKVKPGLYLRTAHHTIRTVSHDEITGMLVSSFCLKTEHGKEIVDYLVHSLGNYPATGKAKTYQPSNFYLWGLLVGKSWHILFAPLYILSFLGSMRDGKEKTSSKLIYMNELYHGKKTSKLCQFLWKFFVKKMKKQYGEDWGKQLFAIYFSKEDKDHPLIYLSERVSWKDF